MKKHLSLAALASLLLLTGCATHPSLYQWGGYDAELYQTYKDPSKVEAFRLTLQTHIDQAEKSQHKVAPGLYAELGTLYLQAGDRGKALAFYSRERDTWPESKYLMDTMIKNIERRQAQGSKP